LREPAGREPSHPSRQKLEARTTKPQILREKLRLASQSFFGLLNPVTPSFDVTGQYSQRAFRRRRPMPSVTFGNVLHDRDVCHIAQPGVGRASGQLLALQEMKEMNFPQSTLKLVAAGFLAAGALFAAASANAGTSWSVGINVPGVVVSVPAPVYYEPAPVYSRPAPTYYQPAPVYSAPAPVYYESGPSWEERRAQRWEERREWRRRQWEREQHRRYYEDRY